MVALLVGILVTLLASLRPAVRATACRRSPPCAKEPRSPRAVSPATGGRCAPDGARVRRAPLRPLRAGLSTTEILLLWLGALLIFFGIALLSSGSSGRCAGARVAGDENRRRRRHARAGQRAAQPAADGLDRGGADDRARARHARRRARGRDRHDLQGRRERPLRRRLRDHGAEQLLADPDRRRRGGAEDARRDRGRQRADRRGAGPRRTSSSDGGRRAGTGRCIDIDWTRARRPSSRRSGERRLRRRRASPRTTTSVWLAGADDVPERRSSRVSGSRGSSTRRPAGRRSAR